jgi:hypothetical protein
MILLTQLSHSSIPYRLPSAAFLHKNLLLTRNIYCNKRHKWLYPCLQHATFLHNSRHQPNLCSKSIATLLASVKARH